MSTTSRETSDAKRPETVQLLLQVWLAVVVLECVHQVLGVALTLFNREALLGAARTTAEDAGENLSDSVIEVAAYGSLALSTVISLIIIAILAWMLRILANNTKRAATARRLWFVFSIYFAMRLLLVFIATPAGSDAPDWLFLIDGAIQILIGVAAIMGIIFCTRQETLDYTGELEQMRQMEKELEEARREKQRAKEEKERQKKQEERDKEDAK
ncbi:hypothetical protein VVR26_05170 [Corynebacterium camporealensis]|uniref:hypothetical protein n=1 Tax=Corynebacterium camporealensis TaxID=161896 RepID=UPI0034CE0387